MYARFIREFDGIEFNGDYAEAFYCFKENPENPAIPLVRDLFALARCGMDEV